ncbi:MAG: GNAT family N-acetyltransferase [Thermodesulfobacteriota bacterium]
MRTEELVELCDLNFAEANRELSRRAGGATHDEDGLMLYAGAHELPVLMNGVLRTASRLGPDEVLARANAFFAPRRRGYSILIRAHADDDLACAAEAAGLEKFGEPPAMVLERPLPAAVAPPGVTLRRVESEEDAAAFGRVMGEAYATYGMPPDCGPATVGRLEVLAAPHIATFVAARSGEVLAGAMVIVTHGVGGVYWVGTVPAARGRGLAELCTRAASNAGFDLGARIAALQASVMGEPIYRRMGYVTVTRYPSFVRFSPPSSSVKP